MTEGVGFVEDDWTTGYLDLRRVGGLIPEELGVDVGDWDSAAVFGGDVADCGDDACRVGYWIAAGAGGGGVG